MFYLVILHFIFSLLSFVFSLLGILVSVAFIILLERKVLGYIQIRKGPNKVGVLGVIQSFSDAIKLFIKEQMIPLKSNIILFYVSPCLSLFIVIFLWNVIPKLDNYLNFTLSGLFFFCCTRFSVYSIIGRGWSSNSNYSLIGAIRGIAQTVSYEVRLAVIFIRIIFLLNSYNLRFFCFEQKNMFFFILFIPIIIVWYISTLAETNRTPFDFAEGESELVSGFNIEYGSGGFALIFLAEYARIIFISYLISTLFFGGILYISQILFNIVSFFFIFSIIWIRSCYPRFRYDKLILLAWKLFLPVSLQFIIYFCLLRAF